jgi:hypothetical protein
MPEERVRAAVTRRMPPSTHNMLRICSAAQMSAEMVLWLQSSCGPDSSHKCRLIIRRFDARRARPRRCDPPYASCDTQHAQIHATAHVSAEMEFWLQSSYGPDSSHKSPLIIRSFDASKAARPFLCRRPALIIRKLCFGGCTLRIFFKCVE